jgi:hypothetical protein
MKSICIKEIFLLLAFMIITSLLTGYAVAQTSGTVTGACVIRDSYTNLPLYNDADSGKGYAMQKMGTVAVYNDIKSKCLDSIYQQITYTYCHSNTNSAQWQVALYDGKGNFKTVGMRPEWL